MNHLKIYSTCLLTSACMLNIGCVNTVTDHARGAYKSINRALASDNTQTDQLYAQVGVTDQQRVNQLNHELQITRENEQLARLQQQRDDLQQQRSRTHARHMELLAEETEHRVQLAKLEAIDRNRLGDRVDNIERIADTHVDALKIQQKRLQLQGEVDILDIKISNIDTDITAQQQKITQLKKQS